MPNPTCTIDGCDKPARSPAADWCPKHYQRWYRHGDPLHTVPRTPRRDLAGHTFGMLTVIGHQGGKYWHARCECGAKTTVATGDLNRGTTTSCGDRAHRRVQNVAYSAVHGRLRRDLGPANLLRCIDCDAQASHWSYDHTDPDEVTDANGLPYSLNADYYQPRCVSCHKRYDLGRAHHAG